MTAIRPARGRDLRQPGWRHRIALTRVVLLLLLLGGCAYTAIPAGPTRTTPAIAGEAVRVRDDVRLPLHRWLPADGTPAAVILALHGFNDYGAFFAAPGAWLADRGIAAYAYDQRGFGRAPNRGYWAGTETLVADLRDAVAAIRARHPGTPLYVLGESMGGAVTVVAAATPPGLPVDGLILAAPAVRGRATMPWYETAALWLSSNVAAEWTLTGAGLGVQPSDNIEMLRARGRDPLVIKETRVAAVAGLVDLMDAAQAAAPRLRAPMLILLGGRDELVPDGATRRFVTRLGYDDARTRRIALYPEGYHMLLHDLAAETVWADIAAWIADPTVPLPSGVGPLRLSRGPAPDPWTGALETP